MSHATIPTKKVGVYPLPAIGISSKKSSDESNLIRLSLSVAYFFKGEKQEIICWLLVVGETSPPKRRSPSRRRVAASRQGWGTGEPVDTKWLKVRVGLLVVSG